MKNGSTNWATSTAADDDGDDDDATNSCAADYWHVVVDAWAARRDEATHEISESA